VAPPTIHDDMTGPAECRNSQARSIRLSGLNCRPPLRWMRDACSRYLTLGMPAQQTYESETMRKAAETAGLNNATGLNTCRCDA